MRVHLLALLAVGLACAPALGQRPAPRGADYRTIQNKLDQARISFDFSGAPLEDVIQLFREAVEINIVIDPEVHKQALRVPVWEVEHLPAGNALDLVLSLLKLTRQFRDGVLFITTVARVERTVYTRIYNVRDLLVGLRDFPGPTIDFTAAGKGPGVTVDNPKASQVYGVDGFTLLAVIRDNADKFSWDGKITIELRNGRLFVNQTRSGHYEVRRLLMLLRSHR